MSEAIKHFNLTEKRNAEESEFLRIRLANEKDTGKIYDFINMSMNRNGLLENRTSVFIDEIKYNKEFLNKARIRKNLFNNIEQFIICEENESIKMLLVVEYRSLMSSTLNLNLLITEEEDMETFSKTIQETGKLLRLYGEKAPTKVRACIKSDTPSFKSWSNLLNKLGFITESIKENELGKGISLVNLIIYIQEGVSNE